MNEHEEARRGAEATALLNNSLFNEAYKAIEARIIDQLAQAEIDPQRAEYLRQLLVAGRKHRKYIEAVAFGGTKAAEEIARKQTIQERLAERMKRFAA